jgi:hypothetical protein
VKRQQPSFPGTGKLVSFAAMMAGFEFLIRLAFPGVSVLNMHLGDFAQYVLLFVGGIMAERQGWLEKLSYTLGMKWLAVVLPAGFAAWLLMMTKGRALAGDLRLFYGGLHWQQAAFAVWESFTCVAISYGLLVLYRKIFNKQGRAGKFLSDNAFSVYVFHPPVVIAGARLLHHLAWHPLLKFALLTMFGCIASFALSAAVFRRIPLLRRILV